MASKKRQRQSWRDCDDRVGSGEHDCKGLKNLGFVGWEHDVVWRIRRVIWIGRDGKMSNQSIGDS